MFGGSKSAASTAPTISSINIQTAGYGTVIQICYGTNRVSPTLGWTGDFTKTKVEYGKGFGGADGQYTYTASVLLFVCEGEIRGYGKAWRDKDVAEDIFDNFSYTANGTVNQAVWSYLAEKHSDEALSYSLTAFVAASAYQLNMSASLGNHSFEIFGRALNGDEAAQNHLDAHIKDVITDFLNHYQYGAISEQTASLTLEMTQMHSYCRARGLLISPLLSEQRPAHEYLTEWATIANCEIVWSEGVLKFIPYADETFTNSYGTYTPDTTIRFSFNDDNVGEPILPNRKKLIDCFNQLTVECKDRSNSYNKYPAVVKDQAAIEQFGLRPASTLTFNSICLPSIAIIVAHTELQKGLYIRNQYTIKTDCAAHSEDLTQFVDLLEPMDFIALTDLDLGLNNARCRIISIEDEYEGNTTIVAEEAPLGVYCG